MGMMVVAALFGLPVVIDPPPAERAAEVQQANPRGKTPKRGKKR